jgi:protein Mpv17
MARRFRLLYDGWLHRYPLLTKATTSAMLFGTGDRIAQRIEAYYEDDSDTSAIEARTAGSDGTAEGIVSPTVARTMRMMAWGAFIHTPLMHTWYNTVDRVVKGRGMTAVLKKVVSDMILVAPQMPIWFFTSTQLMEGVPFRDALDVAIVKTPATVAANYSLWPMTNIITFGVVPLEYRLLFVNIVSLGWSAYLSEQASKPVENERREVRDSEQKNAEHGDEKQSLHATAQHK